MKTSLIVVAVVLDGDGGDGGGDVECFGVSISASAIFSFSNHQPRNKAILSPPYNCVSDYRSPISTFSK